MSRIIGLTQGYETVVDDDCPAWVFKRRWYASVEGENRVYAATKRNSVTTRLHRALLNPEPRTLQVIHLDGDTLNNQRSNLKAVTASEVRQKVVYKKRVITASKYRGVCWSKQRSRWYAKISVGGREKWLGSFVSEEEAAYKYNEAAKALRGEGALINKFDVVKDDLVG